MNPHVLIFECVVDGVACGHGHRSVNEARQCRDKVEGSIRERIEILEVSNPDRPYLFEGALRDQEQNQ